MNDTAPDPRRHVPLASLSGARPSAPDWFEKALAHAPERGFVEAIPESYHHVLIDQPLALIAVLRALLAGWDSSAEGSGVNTPMNRGLA